MILCDNCGKLLDKGEIVLVVLSIEIKNEPDLSWKIRDKIVGPMFMKFHLCLKCYNKLINDAKEFMAKHRESFYAMKVGKEIDEE